MNPRLQVEHPVTEGIMDVNLPATQLLVTMGIPLHRIADVRAVFGAARDGTDRIDFVNTPKRAPRGHVIAARVTGENPDQGFKPTSGHITQLTFRSAPGVYAYFGVGGCGALHEFADSQFGHIFAHGATRDDARRRLVSCSLQ